MSTPAEIIAARVNGTYVEEPDNYVAVDTAPQKKKNTPPPLVADDLAFPALGGGKKVPAAATNWGPLMKAPAAVPVAARKPVVNGGAKLLTIQDAFLLDVADQIAMPRTEFVKILTHIKTDTHTLIESLMLSLKRTFLISGKPENVKEAKRLVVRKLTKPVVVSFAVPLKIRLKIIGQGGRTLKPIIAANLVKIDVGHPDDDAPDADDDDVFAATVPVTIEGDVDGCKRAKAQIQAIVAEETKNLSVKLAVDDAVKPFAQFALALVVEAYPELDFSVPTHRSLGAKVVIVGDREQALAAKQAAQQALDAYAREIATQVVAIPAVKHQFLPVAEVLEQDHVFINVPAEGTQVEFVGAKDKLAGAQEKARQTTSQYKVEVLDMSRAHGGNLDHVKAVAQLLHTNGAFKSIGADHGLTINAPLRAHLTSDVTLIPIEIVAKNDQADAVKKARSQIVATVNLITPDKGRVVADIDPFLVPQVRAAVADAASEHDVLVVVLGDRVHLFATAAAADDDFVDAADVLAQLEAVDAALAGLRAQQQQLTSEVLAVAAADQEHVSGPHLTTLKLILALVDGNHVKVALGTPDADLIRIHGFRDEVAAVKKQVEAVVADAKEHGNTYLSLVTVPGLVVLRVIGKAGANLNGLRDEYGVRIEVPPALDLDKVDVEIVGIKRNVEAAAAKLATLAKRWADETSQTVKIESKYHKRMIGPLGVYTNRLQDKYNVRIRFPHVNDAVKSDEVTVSGPSRGVTKCVEELKELYAYEKENGHTQQVRIPLQAIARVIGRSGETINDIADGTGVEYKFKRDKSQEEEVGYAEVELTGTKTALKDAVAKINDIVNEVENYTTVTIDVDPKYHRDLIGQGGLVMKEIVAKAGGEDLPRGKYYKLLTIPNEGLGLTQVTLAGDKTIVDKVIAQVKAIVAAREAAVDDEWELAKEKHKLIVGPGGLIRHAIQDEFGVVIDIPRPNDKLTTIKIAGLPDKVAAAKAKMEEMTKDDWNDEIAVPALFHPLVSERGAVFKNLMAKHAVEVVHGPHTRKASKLSQLPIPVPPEQAHPAEGETTLFTIVEAPAAPADQALIPWRLKGDTAATAKAAEYIKLRLALAEQADHQAWFYAQNPSVFSKIIGPGGSKVNEIRQQTGTFITIPRANDKNGNFVYLLGTKDNLAKAQEVFAKLV